MPNANTQIHAVSSPRRFMSTVESGQGFQSKRRSPFRKIAVAPMCRALRQICVTAPVERGAVVASNVIGTGVDIIATRDMPCAPPDVVKGEPQPQGFRAE